MQAGRNRFLKYKAELSTSSTVVTPTVGDVTICYADAANSPPTFGPVAAISRQQGSPGGAAVTIGTAADANTAAGSLSVTQVAGGSATGITIGSITNTAGSISAAVSASCTATSGSVRFQVSDGSVSSTGDLQVNVVANSAPTLSYPAATSISPGAGATVSPTTGPGDNGTLASLALLSQGSYTGTIGVNNATGVVTLVNAAPAGAHTITVRATDNCSTNRDAILSLTVPASDFVFANGFEN